MAITLTSQLTDVVLDPGSPTNLGTGNAQASETVIQLQGANCAATGHSGSVGPVSGPTIANLRGCTDAGNNVTRTDTHLHIWFRDLYPVRNVAVGGCCLYLLGGSAALYFATGLDKGYVGGWFHYILNLDPGDRPAASVGTAPTGNITSIGYEGNISASKGEAFLQNCYFDAIRSGTGGQGITFTGGTSGARHTFDDCAAADTARYGLLQNVGGSLKVEGCLTFGAATLTTYIQDSLGTLVFSNLTVNNGTGGTTVVPSLAPDYYRIVLADATTGVTNLDLVDYTFKGVSRAVPFRLTSNLGAGDAYTSLRTTYLFGEIITLNTLCTSTSDKFIECQTIVPGSITLTDPSFSNCDAVTLTAASDLISGGATSLHNTATSVAFVTTDDFDKIENHDFTNTGGTGWAIDLGTISATRSDDCDGNLFTGYSTTVNGDKAVRVSVASGQTYTINVINGSNLAANLVYNAGTGTVVVVVNPVTTTINVKNYLGANLQNARVLIETSDGTGPLPFEDAVTITQTAGTATVTHTGHAIPDGTNVVIRGATQNGYNKVAVITVTGVNSYTYAVDSGTVSPATGSPVASGVIIHALTSAAGVVSDTRAFSSSQPFKGFIRDSSGSPYHQAATIVGTVSSVSGFSSTVSMLLDE